MVLDACAVAGMILLSLCLIAPPFVCVVVLLGMGWTEPDARVAGALAGIFLTTCFYAWALFRKGTE